MLSALYKKEPCVWVGFRYLTSHNGAWSKEGNDMDKELHIRTEGKSEAAAAGLELSDFILSLIQAFLKTGYYTPDHPEAQKARTGLYDTLQKILRGKGEISFIAVKSDSRSEVFIGGITDEPANAAGFMMKSMAEMFVPKFVEYFDRKNLSSFSMKTAMSRDEFEKFINVMTESPLGEGEGADSEDTLTMKLIKNDILMVSTVFNVDIVGKGRKLPWRVEVSLSRLKRDLNMIPLYKNISEEKASEIRKMVFGDIIRPLKSPKLIEEMLANLDLVSSDLIGFDPEEFERRIIEHIDARSLVEVSRELIRVLKEVKNAFDRLQDVDLLVRLEYLRRITRRVADALLQKDAHGTDLLAGLVSQRILGMEDIPENVRPRVMKHFSLDSFLESPETFLASVEATSDSRQIREQICLLFEFLPVLFSKKRYRDISGIFSISRAKGVLYGMAERQDLTETISRVVYTSAVTADKEDATELLTLLSSLDSLGVFLLADLLDNDNRFIRRSAVEILPRKGPQAVPFITGMFSRKEGWYFARNALIVLAHPGAGGVEVENLFKRLLHHPHPNVRKEAVQGLPAVFGAKAESLLIPLLRDADSEIIKRAISALSAIQSSDPRVFNFFSEVLDGKMPDEEGLCEQVLSAVAAMPVPPGKKGLLETALLSILNESSFFRAVMDRDRQSSSRKVCAIHALASAGTEKSLKTLTKYASSKDPELNKAAAAAIAKIKG